MKKWIMLLILASMPALAQTRNIVPNADREGMLGRTNLQWLVIHGVTCYVEEAYFTGITLGGDRITAWTGGGDMLKSTYDTNNVGIVDNSTKLNNQLPSYYLSRLNHTDTQLAATISDLQSAISNNTRVLASLTNGMDITVGKMLFTNGGTNSWLTMASATTGVWRINGSNTYFNVILGKQ